MNFDEGITLPEDPQDESVVPSTKEKITPNTFKDQNEKPSKKKVSKPKTKVHVSNQLLKKSLSMVTRMTAQKFKLNFNISVPSKKIYLHPTCSLDRTRDWWKDIWLKTDEIDTGQRIIIILRLGNLFRLPKFTTDWS